MKKLITLIVVVAFSICVLSQVPEKMSYQAVIRDHNNVLITNHVIGMRLSILQGSPTGPTIYTEVQAPSTNANGLVTLEIGGVTPVFGTFASINWSSGTYLIKIEVDPTGGTNYTITNTSQLITVPYAFYAKSSQTSINSANRSYVDSLLARIVALEVKTGIIDFPHNNLLAKWCFNFNTNDTIGTYNLTGSGSIFYENGKLGKCVKIENSAILSNADLKSYYAGNLPFTISFWYKSSILPNWSTTIFSMGKSGSNGFDITSTVSYIQARRYIFGGTSVSVATAYDPYTNAYNYNDGHWHHIVATYDGTKQALYVDGAKIGEIDTSISIGSDNTLYLGAERPGVWPCNGNIDNAYFYSRALTDNEVKILWNSGFGL